jgi:L-amino acid N-acyltransferase YncA
MLTIRIATEADAAQIQAIYAPIVRDTAISFEFEPPSVEETGQRIVKTLEHWPWLVCDRGGDVLGYVYAGQHSARAAYQWSADVTVYIHEHARRMGVGRALYTSLFRLLVVQGFYHAYAGVTLPNAGSVGLHESLGFTPVGVYQRVGFKFGAWHDVGWWQSALQPLVSAPTPPVDLDAAQLLPGWDAAMRAGQRLLPTA